MKVLVINASANKERSTTLKLTKAFLEGFGIEASEVGPNTESITAPIWQK